MERNKAIQSEKWLNKFNCKPKYRKKKRINKLLSALGSVRIVKNFDLGLENATSVTVFHYKDQTS